MSEQRRERVRADVVVPYQLDRARDLLWAVFAQAGAADCETPALKVPLEVGPRGRRRPSKTVLAHIVAPVQHRDTYVFPFRWQPTGSLTACYPSLDARIAVTAVDGVTSLLTLAGDYRPPLGVAGAALDRAGMSRVARSTAASIVHQLAAALAEAPARTQ